MTARIVLSASNRLGEVLDGSSKRGGLGRASRSDPAGLSSREDLFHRVAEIRGDRRGGGGGIGAQVADQHGATSRGAARFHVPGLVADQPASGKIESKIAGGLEKHAGLGLSPRMLPAVFGPSRLRVVGAVVETVDKAAAIGLTIQECGYFPMDSIHVLLFVSAARDAALIGDNYQSIAGVTESAESLWNAVEQLHVRRIAEIAIVGDEGVVSV